MMMMKKKRRRRKKKKKKSIDNDPDAARSFSEPLAEAEMEVHVLAIDDSVIDRRIIESLLKTSSYKVTTVDSARSALELLGLVDSLRPPNLKEFEFHLIITDYCMPEMTGYELLKTIKGTASLKKIPVVVMSSENIPNRIRRCLDEGAEEFLLKPVQLADVKRLRDHIVRMKCGYSGSSSSNSSSMEQLNARSFSKRRALPRS